MMGKDTKKSEKWKVKTEKNAAAIKLFYRLGVK